MFIHISRGGASNIHDLLGKGTHTQRYQRIFFERAVFATFLKRALCNFAINLHCSLPILEIAPLRLLRSDCSAPTAPT